MRRIREVLRIEKNHTVIEGAGVKLRRVFGMVDENLDPFLLLDHFGSDDANDYIAGFPWHPHRGIETITYMLKGEVNHGDSLGNKGTIKPGDVQWMTAGSGIIHEEMPKADGGLEGFQLWSNLPSSHKMMKPRYRDIKADMIPVVELAAGVWGKVICGKLNGTIGPVKEIVTDPLYVDMDMEINSETTIDVPAEYNLFVYVYHGSVQFGKDNGTTIREDHMAIFDNGEALRIVTGDEATRFLLIAGRPIREPVAWEGPIVMNSREELRIAYEEYRRGTFLK